MQDKILSLSKQSKRAPRPGKASDKDPHASNTADNSVPTERTVTSQTPPKSSNISANTDKASEPQRKQKTDKRKKSAKPFSQKQIIIAQKKAACKQYLFDTYPAVFSVKNPKPLKIGIRQDVLKSVTEFSNHIVGLFFWSYTHRQSYIKALTIGAERIDLLGKAVGAVDIEAAAQAQAILKTLKNYSKKTLSEKQASTKPTENLAQTQTKVADTKTQVEYNNEA